MAFSLLKSQLVLIKTLRFLQDMREKQLLLFLVLCFFGHGEGYVRFCRMPPAWRLSRKL